MPFEPDLKSPFNVLFTGKCTCEVLDPQGVTSTRIISREDDWVVDFRWGTKGTIVGGLRGDWHVKVYLESIGPGPEIVAGSKDMKMWDDAYDKGNQGIVHFANYRHQFTIPKGTPRKDGAYKLVVCLTSTDPGGCPAPYAAFEEGEILQFYSSEDIAG